MLTTGIVIVFTAGIVIYFYAKCTVATAVSTTLAALFSTIIALTYYEKLSLLFMDKGIGLTWIQGTVFLVLFLLPFLLLRVLSDFVVNSKMDLGRPMKITASLTAGIFCGLLISGNMLLGAGMLPGKGKMLYFRYPPDKPLRIDQPAVPLLNPDGFTASLYGWISRGSLSGKKSFALLHADFVDQNHLNRYGLTKGVSAVCSPESLKLPGRNTKPVRLVELSGQTYTVVRVGISTASVKDGGAKPKEGALSMIPAQLRMICKTKETAGDLSGTGNSIYPKGILLNGNLNAIDLDEPVSPEDKDISKRTRIWWKDWAFSVPGGQEPVLLGFKQNALVKLPEAVPTSEEIEQALETDAEGKAVTQEER